MPSRFISLNAAFTRMNKRPSPLKEKEEERLLVI